MFVVLKVCGETCFQSKQPKNRKAEVLPCSASVLGSKLKKSCSVFSFSKNKRSEECRCVVVMLVESLA